MATPANCTASGAKHDPSGKDAMTRPDSKQKISRQMAREKQLIASAAARLMAEDGLTDYAQAKRKAVQGLNLPENVRLPDNAEVEAELRSYQRLFQDEAQRARIDHLRKVARQIMCVVQRFNPYLTGSVLDGTAGPHSEIDIQLFTDSAKDVEIFLLNQRIDYEHSTPRSDRAEAVLTLQGDDSLINLIVYPRNEERMVFKTRDGRIRPRLRLDAMDSLNEVRCASACPAAGIA